MENILQEIRAYIVDSILFGDGERLQPDTSFQAQSILDSMGLMEVISFIETTYAIEIEDEDMVAENFDTLRDITRLVEKKLVSASELKRDNKKAAM